MEPDEESKALIESHQKEKEATEAEEMEKIDADIKAAVANGKAQEVIKGDAAFADESEAEEAEEAKEDEEKKTKKRKSNKKDK